MTAPAASPYGTLPAVPPPASRKPISLPRLREMHVQGDKITMLTAYDATFKGSAPAMTDFLGGRISMMFDTTSNFVEHVKATRLRALGVTSRKRSNAKQSVPSISETPGMGEYEMPLWLGVLAPAGTPQDVIGKLNAELGKLMPTPQIGKQLSDAGIEPRLFSPAEFAALIRSDTLRLAA